MQRLRTLKAGVRRVAGVARPGVAHSYLAASSMQHATIRCLATRAEQAAARAAALAPFQPLIDELFAYVSRALADMSHVNEGMTVERDGMALRIYTGPGSGAATGHRTFTLQADPATRLVSYASPSKANGLVAYKWEPKTGQWVCKEDGHLLVELMTRELLIYCKGMPNF